MKDVQRPYMYNSLLHVFFDSFQSVVGNDRALTNVQYYFRCFRFLREFPFFVIRFERRAPKGLIRVYRVWTRLLRYPVMHFCIKATRHTQPCHISAPSTRGWIGFRCSRRFHFEQSNGRRDEAHRTRQGRHRHRVSFRPKAISPRHSPILPFRTP